MKNQTYNSIIWTCWVIIMVLAIVDLWFDTPDYISKIFWTLVIVMGATWGIKSEINEKCE